MLPVTSSSYSSGRDKSVLSTAIKQLKRRFGRRLRRSLHKQRFILGGLAVGILFLWWFTRAVKVVPDIVQVCRSSTWFHILPASKLVAITVISRSGYS